MESSQITIRSLAIADYDDVLALWSSTSGMCLREADSREAIARYLERNPGFSFVAFVDGQCVGAILGGHDGRRGYLQHLAVAEGFRRQGLGTRLFRCCVEALGRDGIAKTHLFVLNENELGLGFWQRAGCERRGDVVLFSHTQPNCGNA